ncbi:MAG TPA: hypothetical protein VMF89_15225 [Polyangiales bacterium]|nr:hypothetical protein [Polyangiales bacterium]
MTASEIRLAVFTGPVECRRCESGPVGLVLVGRSADRMESIWLAFEGIAPADLPAVIENAAVQRTAAQQYRIASQDRSWAVAAARVHLHRDVSTAFYGAVPPRAVPWLKRLAWRAGLIVAASPAGRWLIRAAKKDSPA